MQAERRDFVVWHACDINPLYGVLRGESPHLDTGEDIMKLLDAMIRVFILWQGTGLRWLREELAVLGVGIPLTDGCLSEFVREADEATQPVSGPGLHYVQELRHQLSLRARFIQRWTGSDENIPEKDEQSLQTLVRIARKYALPRRWKLSEPVVTEYRRTRPSYWNGTRDIDIDSDALPQS
jgi:hypothetical protein